MSTGRRKISLKTGWLLLPVVIANLMGVLLTHSYMVATLAGRLGERFAAAITVLMGISAVGVVVGVSMLRWKLRALQAVEKGRQAPTPARLAEAVAEVHRCADIVFLVSLSMWVCATLAVVSVMWLGLGMPGELVPRILVPGLLFGPMAALLACCLYMLRARGVVLELAARGLTPLQVIEALPRRTQLRARLMLFTAIAAAIPAALVWDVSTVVTEHAFTRVLEARTANEQLLLADALQEEATLTLLGLSVLVVALGLAAAWLAGALLGQPVRRLGGEAQRVAQGEMAHPRLIIAEEEVWAVSAAFTTMLLHLGGVLAQLQRAGSRIGATTEEILASSTRHQQGASEQSLSLDETSATTEEMARSAGQIAENASSVAEIAQRTLTAAQKGQASAEAFLSTMARMRHDNQAIANSVARLNKRVQQIGQIVEFIHGVADRADLLALNAELEGTKAGEAGQGFSLVAQEMRRLAENVLESTKEIEGLIEEVLDASGAAVTATEGGVRAAESGSVLAQQVSESLRQVVDLAGSTSAAVKAISLSTKEQRSSTGLLADAMSDILRITQRSHEATSKVIGIHGGLSTLAHDLLAAVERFRVDPQPPEGTG